MIFRRRGPDRPADPVAEVVDPYAVPAIYRPAVVDAVRARDQFRSLVDSTPTGPLQEQLRDLGTGVDAGVLAVWHAAQKAMQVEGVVAALDVDRVRDDLKHARRAQARGEVDDTTVDVLTERFASTHRLLDALDELRDRIPVLEARLGTAVARAAELTLTASASTNSELDRLRGELGQVVEELEALQSAHEELRSLTEPEP